ncbi:BRCT domain-containing protein [Hygrophoropsis aurantiaca]|uniref:BRCT domain-containing protein n=1 Tax=Hygrophoropsis aurantiaca TaxID=72124 RepID=A0ACB7ZXB2_9AGAM|nr:BRCT domain-containing protein [Hygrophoropsis aurantiaca]
MSTNMKKRLIKLGIKTTTRPGECTHLVAKSIVRTEKFLCALAVAPFILTEEWATGSAKAGKILPEDNYMLSDPDAEKKWKFKFSDALARSKSEGGPRSFAGMTFCITPKVAIDNKLLKNVVTAAGGTVQTASSPTTRSLKGKENRYVISCPDDISIWRPLVQGGFTVYSPELLLTGVLRQEIDWEDKANMITGK